MTGDKPGDPIVESYSERARQYDQEQNLQSCWEPATAQALASIQLKVNYELVVEVGCGSGRALLELVSKNGSHVRFIGVEPAQNMLARAREVLGGFENVRVIDGRFEDLPIESNTVDYLFSILAFHWTTNLHQSVRELARVLKPDGEMDLFFVGRNTGREFTGKTTPIFLKYMGPKLLLQSARLRKHLTRDDAAGLFAQEFSKNRLTVTESTKTYFDNLEGHWSWWVSRAAGHFVAIPAEKRKQCDGEVRQAIESLAGEQGIPYTVHLLHARVRS